MLGSPKLLSLKIVGAAVEGTVLSVDKKYWGGEEGDSVFRWFRVLIFNSPSLSFLCSVLVGSWAHVQSGRSFYGKLPSITTLKLPLLLYLMLSPHTFTPIFWLL